MDRNADASRTVMGCLLATVVSSTPVVNATFGVFLVPISRDLHWPRARVSVVLIVMALLCAATYPLVGRLADRLGVRRVVLVGNLLFAASVASLSFTGGSTLRTYTLFAVLGITSAIPSAMLYAKLVSAWFSQRRGLLLGLVGGVGNGVGCTLMPMLAGAAVAAWGWRNAYLALGLVVLCVGLPAIVLLLRDPSAAPARTSGPLPEADGLTLAQSMRTVRFWSILGVMALGAGSLTAVFTHVVAMLTDRGIGLPIATLSVGVIAMTGSFWQLVLGTVLDRTGSPHIMAPFFLLAVAGLAILGTAISPAALLAGAFLIGLGIGTDYGAIPYLVGRYFGLRAYGAICGMIFGINVIVLGISPFLTDLVYDRTGSYHLAFLAIATCLVLCAGLCLTLPRYGQVRRIPALRVKELQY
ncbi:MAG: MFS transporter [Janthinobacterium lividum]